MYIKKVKEIPTEGSFVAVWIYQGKPYAGNFTCEDGTYYDDDDLGGVCSVNTLEWLNQDDKNYFIAQEYKNASTRS